MTAELVQNLTEDQKIVLIHAITEQIAYPTAYKGLGYYSLDLPDLEEQLEQMSVSQKKQMIHAIVCNHL